MVSEKDLFTLRVKKANSSQLVSSNKSATAANPRRGPLRNRHVRIGGRLAIVDDPKVVGGRSGKN